MISDPATTHAPAPTMPAPTVDPHEPAEDAAQDPTHDRDDDEQHDEQHLESRSRRRDDASSLRRRLRGQRLAFVDDVDDLVDAGVDAVRELFSRNSGAIVSAMMRLDVASVSAPSSP